MKKELGPMAKLHLGPDNKATGNGKNSISSENVGKIAQNMVSAGISGAAGGAIGKMIKPKPMQSDTIRVSSKYKPGDYVEEYELERRIKKQTGDFPQLSVQDYSEVRKDNRGKNIVVKLDNGPQAIKNPPKKETTDVMGRPYTRTGDSTYDYIMERGYTPEKKDLRKYKRKVKKGKI